MFDLPLEAHGWAVVAHAVALGTTTGQSVVAAVNRIKGTIGGVLVGGASGSTSWVTALQRYECHSRWP
jgi:uncharacterized membrane protein YccC